MAYRAEIQIGVKGGREVSALQDKVERLTQALDAINTSRFSVAQRVNKLTSFQVAQEQKLILQRQRFNDELRESVRLAVEFQQRIEASIRAARSSRAVSSRTLTGSTTAGLLAPSPERKALPSAGGTGAGARAFERAAAKAERIDAFFAQAAEFLQDIDRQIEQRSKAIKQARVSVSTGRSQPFGLLPPAQTAGSPVQQEVTAAKTVQNTLTKNLQIQKDIKELKVEGVRLDKQLNELTSAKLNAEGDELDILNRQIAQTRQLRRENTTSIKELRQSLQELPAGGFVRGAASPLRGDRQLNANIRERTRLEESLTNFKLQGLKVTAAETALEKLDLSLNRKNLNTTEVELDRQKELLKDLREELRLVRQISDNRKGGLDNRTGRQKAKEAAGSALIGGAFPLLFGQGPGAALGGALGGGGGGLIGGQFGFGLSLVGTQLGSIVDQFVANTAELGKALNPLTADISALAAASGEANTEVSQALESIENLGTKTQALELATQLLADTVGTKGVAALQEFGDDATRLANAFSAAMAQMQAAFAQAFGGILGALADFLEKTVDVQAGLANETDPQLQLLKAQRQAAADQPVFGRIGLADKLEDIEYFDAQIADRVKEIRQETADRILGENNILKTKNAINSLGLQDTKLTKLQTKLAGLKNDLTNSEVISTKKALINRREELKIEKARKALTVDGKLDKEAFDETSEKIKNEFAVERLRLNTQIGEAQERAAKKAASQAERLAKQQTEQGRQSSALTNDLQNQLEIIKVAGSTEAARLKIQQEYENTLVRISNLQNQDDAERQKFLADQIRQNKLANLNAEIREKNNKAIREAVSPIKRIREEQESSVAETKEYNRLLMEGVLPSEAKRIANFNEQVRLSLALVDAEILRTKTSGLNNEKLKERLDLLEAERRAIEGEAAKGPGAAAPDQDPKAAIAERVGQLQEELKAMTNLGNVAVTVADNIGGAFSTAFQSVLSGSKSTQEALSDMFKTIAEDFLSMAAEIIAKQLIMITLQTILKALGAVAGAGADAPAAPVPKDGAAFQGIGTSTLDSLGGAGPISDPKGLFTPATLVSTRATGGPVYSDSPYIVGEEGPELFIPGTSGLISNNDQFEAARAALIDDPDFTAEEESVVEKLGTSQEPGQLNQVLRDSRSAVQSITRLSKEREIAGVNQLTKEIGAAAVANTGSTLFGAGSSTTTNNLKEVLGGDSSTEKVISAIQQAAQAEAVTAARDALTETGGTQGEELTASEQAAGSNNNSSVTDTSREYIEKLVSGSGAGSNNSSSVTNTSREYIENLVSGSGAGSNNSSSVTNTSREYIENLVNGSGAGGANTVNNINNSSTFGGASSSVSNSSTLGDSRTAVDRVTALNQTRQMLESVSSVNKERDVERVMESTANGNVKPLDVRYESQVINNVEYVTAEQHRRGLAEAAERGRAITLQTLQNSVKSRRRLGLA